MSSNIAESLLNGPGSREIIIGNAPAEDANTETDVIANRQSRPPILTIPDERRRFLIRLATTLHSYGCPYAKYLIEKAADKLGVKVDIFVFPSWILLSFPGVDLNDPNQKELISHAHSQARP